LPYPRNANATKNLSGEGSHNYNYQRRLVGKYLHRLGPTHFSNIARLTKRVEMNFVLLSLIASKQFARMDHKDPYNHLSNFFELCMGVPITSQVFKYIIIKNMKLFGNLKL